MIRHIFKDGTTSNKIEGHLVKRTDCPTAYKVMEGMNIDNGRKTATGKEADGQVQGKGKASKV